MLHSDIAALIKQTDSYPPLPRTVLRVLEITGDPESSAHELMQAILPDQSICVAILKIVNSAFFGHPRKVCSIEQAVIVLGFVEIRNIILAQAVFSSFHKFRKTNKEDIEALWQHSLTCALAAKIIATHITGYAPNQLFIAGLIHDIGKLTLLIAFPNYYNPLPEISGSLLHSAAEEEEKFGISHSKAGMLQLNRWLFPEELCAVAGYHHNPAALPDNAGFPLIVQMANIISHCVTGPETMTSRQILDLINELSPESPLLWRRYNFDWHQDNIEEWLIALQTELADGTIINMFND